LNAHAELSLRNEGATGRAWRSLHVAAAVMAAGAIVKLDLPVCPLALVAGIPCPGCGLTRATLSLLHGDLQAALRFHPLVLLLTPLFSFAMFEVARRYVVNDASRTSWLHTRAFDGLAWALLALVLGVWLARFAGAFGGPAPVQSLFALIR